MLNISKLKRIRLVVAIGYPETKEVRKKVRKNKPPEGLIEMLIITEKQFSGIEYISGEEQNCVIDGEERLIVI